MSDVTQGSTSGPIYDRQWTIREGEVGLPFLQAAAPARSGQEIPEGMQAPCWAALDPGSEEALAKAPGEYALGRAGWGGAGTAGLRPGTPRWFTCPASTSPCGPKAPRTGGGHSRTQPAPAARPGAGVTAGWGGGGGQGPGHHGLGKWAAKSPS